MVFLQDLVRGWHIGHVHCAAAVQVGEGNPRIAQMVLYRVLVPRRGGRRVLHPALRRVDGFPCPVPVLYAADVVLCVVCGGARLYGLFQLRASRIVQYFNGVRAKGKQFWEI